jgi:hypothetical protein
VLIGSAAGGYYEHRLRVAEQQRVARDVRTALEITSETLARVQQRVRESSERE